MEILEADDSLVGVFGAWYETGEHLEPIGEPMRGFGLKGRTRFGCADFGAYCVTTTCVTMVRTRPFGEFPQWWREADVGDWPLHMLNTDLDDYLFVDEILSAHRNHGSGIWSARSQHDQILSAIRTQELFLANLSQDGPIDRRETARAAAVASDWGRARGFLRDSQYDSALAFCARHHRTELSRFKLWRRLRRARRHVGRGLEVTSGSR